MTKINTKIVSGVACLLIPSATAATHGNGSADYGITKGSFNPNDIPNRSATVSTKSSNAINDELEDISAQGGGDVMLNSGRYDTTSSVLMKTKTALKGKGYSKTFIRRNRGASALKSSASRPYIVDASGKDIFETVSLAVDGNHLISELENGYAEGIGALVFGDGSNEANIWSCKAQRSGSGYLGGDMIDFRIVNSNFSENGSKQNGLHHNIYMRRTKRLWISNTDSNDALGGMGFKIWGNTTGSTDTTKDLWMEDCDLDDNDHTNFSVASMYYVRIEGSQFDDSTGPNLYIQGGIYVGDAAGRGCKYVDIINNISRGNEANGIRVKGSDRVNIEGNFSRYNDDDYSVENSTNVSNDNNQKF